MNRLRVDQLKVEESEDDELSLSDTAVKDKWSNKDTGRRLTPAMVMGPTRNSEQMKRRPTWTKTRPSKGPTEPSCLEEEGETSAPSLGAVPLLSVPSDESKIAEAGSLADGSSIAEAGSLAEAGSIPEAGTIPEADTIPEAGSKAEADITADLSSASSIYGSSSGSSLVGAQIIVKSSQCKKETFLEKYMPCIFGSKRRVGDQDD